MDEARSLTGSTQLSISSFPSNTSKDFDFEVFKGSLIELFTTEQVPFSLVDAKAFRQLLIYLQPLLSDCIPTGSTLRRHITKAYDQGLARVEQGVQQTNNPN